MSISLSTVFVRVLLQKLFFFSIFSYFSLSTTFGINLEAFRSPNTCSLVFFFFLFVKRSLLGMLLNAFTSSSPSSSLGSISAVSVFLLNYQLLTQFYAHFRLNLLSILSPKTKHPKYKTTNRRLIFGILFWRLHMFCFGVASSSSSSCETQCSK